MTKPIVALAAFLIAISAFAARPTKTPKKRVIISTDLSLGLVGGWRKMDDADDGWAVPMALGDDALDVRVVVTVLGNSNVEAEEIVSRELLRDVMHSTVKRAKGAALKLDDPQATLNGKPLTRDCWNAGVQAMNDVLAAGKATIIAIGPLTDVGCLALNAPAAIQSNIEQVIAIMGRKPGESFAIGEVTGLTDFNLVMDNRALEVLLNQTRIPMTFLPFSLTRQVLVPATFVDSLQNGTPLQRYIYKGTAPWVAFWSKAFAEPGFHPWDSTAVRYASHPETFTCSTVNFRIQNCAAATGDPYNRLGGCAGHSADQKTSLDREAVQLLLSSDLPPTRTVTTCSGYASAAEQAQYEAAVRAFLQR